MSNNKLDEALASQEKDAKYALEILELIDELRDGEGDSVTIYCDNPDFNNLPNNQIEVFGEWTNWHSQHVHGDTLKECLENALKAKKEMEKTKVDFNTFLASRIKLAREEQGMSQEDLALAMGFKSRVTVSEIEAGRRKVHSEELMQLIRVLNKDIDYFTDQIAASAAKAEIRITEKS